eukprot:m.354239 g.354239  ORF g.354239 m.354239 type:complete len:324 (-) comp16960_c1_seq1:464-1435(-)
MGNIVKVLMGDGKKPGEEVFLDFEGATPSDEEKRTYDNVAAVLDRKDAVLADLAAYEGAEAQIRSAIQSPSDEALQLAAWDTVCPLVLKLKELYDYSAEIEGVLPQLLLELCAENPIEALEQKQAIAKQFADVLYFVLKFDDMKMNNPAIQNDFSYYRRTLNRKKMNSPADEDSAVVSPEEANRMSLFYAYPTPMLKVVSEATTKFVSDHKEIPIDNTTDCLSSMAAICRIMLDQPDLAERFEDPETILYCQRVMVGVIILYDHVHLIGAFSKRNPSIDIRGSIKALKKHESANLEGLLNALRFSTKHLNDESTPKEVKKLLA